MAVADKQVKKRNSRRLKKRRTEDFSSSSSSSSSESESEPETTNKDEMEIDDAAQDVTLNGIDFSRNESKEQSNVISDETKLKLNAIQITNIPNTGKVNREELLKITDELNQEEKDLQNKYLVKMMNEYDLDLDQLRLKPDFDAKSLPLLAKILKNGANVFDEESLKTILRN